MSKGRYRKKKTSKLPVFLIVAVVLILSVVLVMLLKGNDGGAQTDPSKGAEISGTQAGSTGETTKPLGGEEDSSGAVQGTENPTGETQVPSTAVTQPPIEIVERKDAEYEKWLAAAMMVCVSMDYPDFELEGIYAASASSLADKMESEGAYIIFTSGGVRMAIHSAALEAERTGAGTKDISTEAIGFASFDLVDPAAVDTANLQELDLEELSELIAQSILVSIYEH